MRLLSYASPEDWLAAALECFVSAALAARAEGRSRVDFCLAGGSTPAPLYRALAASAELGQAAQGLGIGLWLGDERELPPDHAERNGRLVSEAFGSAPWPHELHLWPPVPAAEAALAYASEIVVAMGRAPVFDLALLGLGEDGHTASLFPGDPILGVRDALAWPSLAPSEPRRRMSLTYPALAASRAIRFFVRGPGKASLVQALAQGEGDYPAYGLDGEASSILFCPN